MDPFSHLPPVTAPPDHHHHHPTAPTPPFSGNSAHPPYPEMIMSAIGGLDEKEGSSRQAIAKYMERHYSKLPPSHPKLLSDHLKRMKKDGDLIMIKHSYALPLPTSVPLFDNHFTHYTITPNPPFGSGPGLHLGQQHYGSAHELQPNYAQPPVFAVTQPTPTRDLLLSAKRGRGRPPKTASRNASATLNGDGNGNGNVSGENGGSGNVTEGKRKRVRPKSMSIGRVNGGVRKRGRPKRIGGIVTVPLSGNVASPRGRPKKAVLKTETVSGDVGSGSGSRSRGRGRPPKNKFRNSFGAPSKVGPGTAVLVTDPHQLVAYQELKLKYEHLQTKAKEVVGVVRPYINPDYEAFGALQELETLVGHTQL